MIQKAENRKLDNFLWWRQISPHFRKPIQKNEVQSIQDIHFSTFIEFLIISIMIRSGKTIEIIGIFRKSFQHQLLRKHLGHSRPTDVKTFQHFERHAGHLFSL